MSSITLYYVCSVWIYYGAKYSGSENRNSNFAEKPYQPVKGTQCKTYRKVTTILRKYSNSENI